jgi:hypothetical protein
MEETPHEKRTYYRWPADQREVMKTTFDETTKSSNQTKTELAKRLGLSLDHVDVC